MGLGSLMSSPLIALSLDAIGETAWNRLLPADATPFLSFAFLKALEDSGCVSTATGWTPQHLAVRNTEGEITHLAPAYIKHHSYGEYVFDWQWARAYEQYRVPYYPKLLLAIPFTPVPGPRILGDVTSFPWTALNDYCQQHGLSGWHLNYPTHLSAPLSASVPDAHPRLGTQFQWHNDGYTDFTDFVGRFASRKRKNVLKERRRVQEQGISLERTTAISEDQMAFFFECYRDTYLKRGSTPYLSLSFFQTLRECMTDQLMMVIATDPQGPCAAALCFYDDTTLYGRYWGCLRDYDALHFEACYYQGIEFCIERSLSVFNPGTQGEHKIARGFGPVATHSLHWLAHPDFHQAIGRFCDEEAEHVRLYMDDARALLPFKASSD